MKTTYVVILYLVCFFFVNYRVTHADITSRVVSLSPVITEIVIELNAAQNLVGVTDFCKKPVGNKEVKSVGSYLNTSVETIYMLKPDIVIAPKEEVSINAKLSSLGIKTILISNHSVKEINEGIILIGALLSREDSARELVMKKTEEMLRVKAHCTTNKSKHAIFLFDEGVQASRFKYYVASSTSFYGMLLSDIGFSYAYTSQQEYAEISLEGIRAIRPDFIFIVMEHEEAKKTFLSRMKAIHDVPIIFLPKDPIVYPGPRYPEIAKHFCSLTHMGSKI